MPLFVNAEKLPYGGRFGVIEQNRPYQTSDLFQKNETHFPRCVGLKLFDKDLLVVNWIIPVRFLFVLLA